ncbi:MAG: hypothetical protein ACFFCT_05830 [Candidatus Odinarchaeota archaeon]
MEEIIITGLLSKISDQYVITTDEGIEYILSAILPWEAVSADYGSEEFASHLGKRLTVRGLSDGSTIYRAIISEIIS